MHEDPLRPARLAVQAGRFSDAWDALAHLREPVRLSPEWMLLAAVTHFRLGEFARSRAAGLQARDGFRTRGDVDGEMRAENTAAAGAFALGDLVAAERGFQRAMALAHHLEDTFTSARCANNLGNVAYYRAKHAQALGFYRLATTGFEKIRSWKGMAEGWLNTAIVWQEDGNLRESREAADRAIDSAERAGDARVLAQALAARAETALAQGDLQLGHALVTRALDLARQSGDPLAEADALRIHANLERTSGGLRPAEDAAKRGLEIAQRLQHPWAEGELYRDLGLVYAAQGRYPEAADAFEAAGSAFRRLGAVSRAEEMQERAAAYRTRS